MFTMLEENSVRNCLLSIIDNIASIEIEDENESLFGSKYNLSAEMFTYILLAASRELCFDINDTFIDSLTDYSLIDLVGSIKKSTNLHYSSKL